MSRWKQLLNSTYARMFCPDPSCPFEGTVPGVKRHCVKRHPGLSYIAWPATHQDPKSRWGDRLRGLEPVNVCTLSFRELRSLARRRGVSQFGKSKADLVHDLQDAGDIAVRQP